MENNEKKRGKQQQIIYWAVALFAIGLLFMAFTSGQQPAELSLDALVEKIHQGKVSQITVRSDNTLAITLKDGSTLASRKDPNESIIKTLRNMGVTPEELRTITIDIKSEGLWAQIGPLLFSILLPLLLIGGFFYFLIRQSQGAGSQAFSFGKSRARVFTGDKPTVTFDDVAGAEEAKQELQEVVEFLREPQKFTALGARIPKGVLLVGPPGTGKTLMAKAVSGEAGVPFFSISGSEFVEMFVGVGASRVRDLFAQAKKSSPCIVFVDEIDAVGRQRGAGLGGSHDEREQTLNQILVEMDGFGTDTHVIVIAATNRPDILDVALLRPGRFDRQVIMDPPDVRGRRQILEVHSRGKPLAPDVDLEVIAKLTPGFVGADLENLINEAAILAARRNKHQITMAEVSEAVERVSMGPERRSRVINPKERRIVAFHETGHAVVMHVLPKCDPVQKVTIIPRGMAGGYTMPLPEDHVMNQRQKYLDDMAALLGGRVSEELVFGEITTGASNDLERVTEMARRMVTVFGMSDKIGPVALGHEQATVFLGREIGSERNFSEAVAEQVDLEVHRLVMEAYQRTREILTKYRPAVDAIAKKLMEVETLNREDFESLFEKTMGPITT